MNIQHAKKQVLEYAQRCCHKGLTAGTSGNVSWLSESGEMVITPSGIDFMEMTEADVVVTDLDGNVLEGMHKPSSEWPMHAVIYKSRPDIRGIVHTHSPYATAFAVINEPVPVVLVETALFLGGDVRVAPIEAQGTKEVGIGCVKVLENRGACLLQNHGVVAVGKDLQQAFIRAEYTEESARICHLAKGIGKPVKVPDEMVKELVNRQGDFK